MLDALPQKWSNIHLFKCNCFKCASCVHILLAGMVCDPSIKVPSKNLGITVLSGYNVGVGEVGLPGKALR